MSFLTDASDQTETHNADMRAEAMDRDGWDDEQPTRAEIDADEAWAARNEWGPE